MHGEVAKGLETDIAPALGGPGRGELRKFIGPPLEDSFIRYHHATEEQAREMVACYRERYGTIGVGEAAVYPGIPEILDTIENTGLLHVAHRPHDPRGGIHQGPVQVKDKQAVSHACAPFPAISPQLSIRGSRRF